MKPLVLGFVVVVAVLAGIFYIQPKSPELDMSQTLPSSAGTLPTGEPAGTQTTSSIPTETVKITMQTARGDIELELYPKTAPKTVGNFIKLSKEGFYDGTKFHRVIDDFVVQGGDPLSKNDDPRVGTGGPGYMFEDEINPKSLGLPDELIKQYETQGYTYDYSFQSLPVVPAALAMANSGPDTNGSQFFIVTTQDQPHLYAKHTVFGKVVKGMDVVLKIKQGDLLKKVITQ